MPLPQIIRIALVLFIISVVTWNLSPQNGMGAEPSSCSSEEQTTWQISRGLDWANHQYTDIPVYNCNGSRTLFKDKENNFYISKSLSDTPEKLTLPANPIGKVEWDRTRPDILFYLTEKNEVFSVHQHNVKTGRDSVIHTTTNFMSEIAPAHPDGEHLLMGPKDKWESVLEILSLKTGEVMEIPIDKPLHRIRFTMAPDLTVYLNSALIRPKPSWLVDVQTGEYRQVYKGTSTSPNWRPGGTHFCFYGRTAKGADKKLMVANADGEIVKTFDELDNHHLNWSRDGRYIVTDSDIEKPGEYRGWISVIDFEKGIVHKVVEHDSHVDDRFGEKYSPGHPHPQLSPDATKVIYNSTRYGMAHPQVFASVFKRPTSPQNLTLNVDNDRVNLNWDKPKGLEIEQCLVYRVTPEGETLAGKVLLPGTDFTEDLKSGTSAYRVVAQEYSGLKSEPVTVNINK